MEENFANGEYNYIIHLRGGKGMSSMSWVKSKYSRKKIHRAGKIIKSDNATVEERNEAIKIMNNWRSAHGYPLWIISNKLKRLVQKESKAFVVNRLKRLDSIEGKLRRNNTVGLDTMQDIAGCRVVVKDIDTVYAIADKYQNSRIRHSFYKEKDYIKTPKPSGYRSLHRVYKYKSDKETSYNNMLVEIQFRTQLQHIWATALETLSVYTKTNLKAGIGNEEYLRFFALASSLFAIKENLPTVPKTPNTKEELAKEITELDRQFNILDKLKVTKIATDKITGEKNKKGYYLLRLDYNTRRLHISYYSTGKFKEANDKIRELEMENISNVDFVLIEANSFTVLKKAYPNYFGDVSKFLSVLEDELYMG